MVLFSHHGLTNHGFVATVQQYVMQCMNTLKGLCLSEGFLLRHSLCLEFGDIFTQKCYRALRTQLVAWH